MSKSMKTILFEEVVSELHDETLERAASLEEAKRQVRFCEGALSASKHLHREISKWLEGSNRDDESEES